MSVAGPHAPGSAPAPMDSELDFAAHLGAAIRQARTGRKWSQAVLAERLDMSVDFVGMLERGERLPSFVTLFQLATLFGIPVLDLLRPPAGEPWVEEAVALLRALPEGSRDMILTMLRAAAGAAPAPVKPARPAVRQKKKRGG
jgi:transcriptional regulator with XRE-family HTH domain